MNTLELIDQKEQLSLRAESIIKGAENESRKLTEDEQREFDELKMKIEDLDNQIKEINACLKNNKKNDRNMNKFSLIRAINDVANGRQLDERSQEVVEAGKAEIRKAGLSYQGQIILPVEERATIQATVDTTGKENVPEDKMGILEPLRANLVLTKAGATLLTGLVGDVSIPVFSGSNVGWKGETSAAGDGAGTFSEVVLKPKRLTAYVDISKQFLLQDSNDAEAMLKRDIVNAISEKLEKTILGKEAGTSDKPAGIFNGVVAESGDLSYIDVVNMEAALEDKNVSGNIQFIVSPTAKAILKTTPKTAGSSKFVMEDGEIEGYPVLCSSAVTSKGVIMGNFADYVIGQWGATDITVDPYTKSADGCIRLVVNAYFDAAPRRANSFVKKVLK